MPWLKVTPEETRLALTITCSWCGKGPLDRCVNNVGRQTLHRTRLREAQKAADIEVGSP